MNAIRERNNSRIFYFHRDLKNVPNIQYNDKSSGKVSSTQVFSNTAD